MTTHYLCTSFFYTILVSLIREMSRSLSLLEFRAEFEPQSVVAHQIIMIKSMMDMVLIRATNLTFEGGAVHPLGRRRLLKKCYMRELEALVSIVVRNFDALALPPGICHLQTRWHVRCGEALCAVLLHIKRQVTDVPVIDLTT